MATTRRWSSADLDQFPVDDGKRYEIIDGELFVSTQPRFGHQFASLALGSALLGWSRETGLGLPCPSPGLIFGEHDDVAPDLVWLSHARRSLIEGEDGHLHGPPELVVEILSPGRANARRDREVKLDLYGRRGVDEYWLVDPARRRIDVYRRSSPDRLAPVVTLQPGDQLESPLLPGFSCPVESIFATAR